MARPIPAMLTASAPPRPVWPVYSPIGRAMTRATRIARADSSTCSTNRVGIPLAPCQWAGSDSQPNAPVIPSIGSARASCPGRQEPLDELQEKVEDERDDDDQHEADVDHR